MKKDLKNSHGIEQYENEDSLLLLDNIRLIYDKFQDKLVQLSILRELGRILLYINDFTRICRTIMDITINNTVARNCSIMLLDFNTEKLFLVAATNPKGESYVVDPRKIFSREDLQYYFAPGEGVAGEAVRSKKPVLINDVNGSELFDKNKQTQVRIRTLLSVPLVIEDVPCGVFTLSHPEPDMFKPNDVNLFVIVSNIVALALNSALSYETLKYSEEKYRALAEYSNDGITIIQDGMHVYANPSYKSVTGFSLKELKPIPFNDLICPTDAPGCSLNKMNPLQSDIPGTFEASLLTKKGKKIAVEVSHASFIYMGRHAKIISIRDLRERKELEFKLHQAQKMEALGVIAGGVAHDLNNILSGITSYPELLLMEMPENNPLRKPIMTIKQSGEKAIATVQDLLTLARRGAAAMEVIQLNYLVDEYLDSPEHKKIKTLHPDVRIEKKLEADNLNILGSPYHLAKTLLNLILNGAEAMWNGGTITIRTESRHLDRHIQGYELIKEGDYVTLSVSDTGNGIPSDCMESVFEPFYTKKKFGRSGTGLGLSVVWGTVKDHGGFIDVSSVEGQGTTFTLYFPVTRMESPRDKGFLSVDDYRGRGEKILVVDDVMEQREIASMILTKLGYDVDTVSSGEEAIDYMKDHSADLLILDMIMEPGIDGLETYKKVLSMHPGQKAIITSGFSETRQVREARELGAAAYLRKPYSLEKFGLALRKALDNEK